MNFKITIQPIISMIPIESTVVSVNEGVITYNGTDYDLSDVQDGDSPEIDLPYIDVTNFYTGEKENGFRVDENGVVSFRLKCHLDLDTFNKKENITDSDSWVYEIESGVLDWTK